MADEKRITIVALTTTWNASLRAIPGAEIDREFEERAVALTKALATSFRTKRVLYKAERTIQLARRVVWLIYDVAPQNCWPTHPESEFYPNHSSRFQR